MAKFVRWLFAGIAMQLTGCALMLNGTVSQFHELDGSPKSFVIVPLPEQAQSLEFKTYANMVADRLVARGWRRVELDSADLAVTLQYSMGQGQQIAYSYPILGPVPSGPVTTFGNVNTYGNTSTFNATTRQGTALGVVGSGQGSRTEYERIVRLEMFSLVSYRSTKQTVPVFQSTMQSKGSIGDIARVMPTMIAGLFEDFPGKSGGSRTTSLTIR
jgi:hypothetical protein